MQQTSMYASNTTGEDAREMPTVVVNQRQYWRSHRISKRNEKRAQKLVSMDNSRSAEFRQICIDEYGYKAGSSFRSWCQEQQATVLSKLREEKYDVRNERILLLIQQKFARVGFNFSWTVLKVKRTKKRNGEVYKTYEDISVLYDNRPTLEGRSLSNFELLIIPVRLVDGYKPAQSQSDDPTEDAIQSLLMGGSVPEGDASRKVHLSHGVCQ